jgi:chitinase
MKRIPSILICFLLSLTLFTSPAAGQSSRSDYKVIAYMMGSRSGSYPDSLIRMLTHINFAFAKVVDGEMVFQGRTKEHEQRIRESVARIMEFKKVQPSLKVLISVGGWGAEGFSDAALSDASRKKFAESGNRLIQEYGFDGIDIDWEYPGQPGAGNVYRPEDKENFTLMLKALRENLDKLSKEQNRKKKDYLLLTIATGADQAFVDHTNLGEAQKYLDFINIMTYDFHSGLHPVSGHHTNLYKSALPGASDISTEIAVDRHISAGVPANKLVIGVPFYGRFWTHVPETSNGVYQKSGSVGNYKLYSDIRKNFLTNPAFKRYWDPEAKAPYLYSKDSSMMISYDDPESLGLKMKFLKQKGLTGVMFWEYHGDHDGELLNTLHKSLMMKNPED